MLLWGLSMAFGLTTLFMKGGAEIYFNVTFYLIPLLVGLIVGQYRAIRMLLKGNNE